MVLSPSSARAGTAEVRIGEPVSHHLHRHRPLELPVGGSPHIAHGPGAKDLLEDVPPGKFGPSLHSGSPV